MISHRLPDDQGHELALSLRGAYAHLRRSSNQAFAAFGMTSDQFVLLMALAREGQATQQRLTRLCFSDAATIGGMVHLLARKGFLARTDHPLDGRAWAVQLTAPGRALVESMRKQSAGLRARITRLFDPNELGLMIELLDRVALALEPPARRSASRNRPRVPSTHRTPRNRRKSRPRTK